jgi:uracil-DNA glycosylase family 4
MSPARVAPEAHDAIGRRAEGEIVVRLERSRLLGERFVLLLPREVVETSNVEGQTGVEPSSLAGTVEAEWPGMASSAERLDIEAWEEVRAAALVCRKCELCQGRTTVVWGSGTPYTRLLVVGEAPGFHEDQQGEAFVGPAGQLLTKILAAIGFARDQVFITNVLKCRPPRNADPQPHQVAACEPYLVRQIELIGPAAILALGRHAARTLLRTEAPMSALRGRVFRYQGVPLVATYHPAALLRNPNLKRPTWEDVQLLRRIYDQAVSETAGGTP